jgi:molybdopterin-guanine dinucleotide biosynthesis protein B
MPQCKAVAFTGPSGSGKTTTIERLVIRLSPSRRVAVIKHDPKSKARFDRAGKDSDRFYRAGADVAVVSPDRTALFRHRHTPLERLVEDFRPFDLLLVEGLKTWSLPRIGIFRGEIDEAYLPYVSALAIDETINISKYDIPEGIDLLDLNDTDGIIDWIDRHAAIFTPRGGD